MRERQIARMVSVKYDDETGQVFVLMEVTDPAMKADLLRGEVVARLVVDEEDQAWKK